MCIVRFLGIGATGLTVLGQLGEAPKLDPAEAVAAARQMIRRASALPVIVGVCAPGFAAMRVLTREVMAAGAAGVWIAPPNALRSDKQIRRLRGANGANTGYAFPEMRCGVGRLSAAGQREAAHDPRARLAPC